MLSFFTRLAIGRMIQSVPASITGKLVPFDLLVSSGLLVLLSVDLTLPPVIESLDLTGLLYSTPGLCKFSGLPSLSPDSHQGTQDLSGFFAHHAQTIGSKEHCHFFYFCSSHPPYPQSEVGRVLCMEVSFQESKREWVKNSFDFDFFIQTYVIILAPPDSQFICQPAYFSLPQLLLMISRY